MGLTDAQLDTFAQRGYVVLERFLDARKVARVGAWVDELARAGENGVARYYERGVHGGDEVLVRIEHILGPAHTAMRDLILDYHALACLADALGDEPVLFKDKVNFKPPGGRADKLHQDQAAGWDDYTDCFVTLAIAIDENTPDTAPLSFLGTGRYPRALMTPRWQPIHDDDPPYTPVEDYEVILARPGDAILFDSYVPHGSPPNLGDRGRRNLFLTFNRRSDGDHRERYYRDKWASYPPNTPASARTADSFRV